ncbi:MAG: hypothetical protein V1707_00105 [bacterium]
MPVPKKETPEERDARIAREVKDIFREESNRGIRNAESSKKPGLDYYNRREKREDGSDVPYQGRYGKFKKE